MRASGQHLQAWQSCRTLQEKKQVLPQDAYDAYVLSLFRLSSHTCVVEQAAGKTASEFRDWGGTI